jgi:hypothetical protein
MTVLVGHPFDTVRARWQLDHNKLFTSLWHCAKRSARHVDGIFIGMSAPLAIVPLVNSTTLPVYAVVKRRCR